MPASILIVDDERHTREGLEQALMDDYDVYLAANTDEAFNLLDSQEFDVVLTDLKMAGKSGMKVIDKTLAMRKKPVAIMMTAYGSVETAVEAMKRGAFDFLTKPLNLQQLEVLIRRAVRHRREERAANAPQRETATDSLPTPAPTAIAPPPPGQPFAGVVGQSAALEALTDQVRRVAPSRATVLLQGETGTGKELIARAIHENSDRADRPFVAVHCAALAANLLESELFGHEKGAFTGASERRVGRFEAANGGTLFLDEIGEIDASTQVKLLRFLEARTFERLGSNQLVSVDVRLVAATNRDLAAMAAKGEFRDDLLFRLNVVTLRTPALRERVEDIPVLLEHYIAVFAEENQAPPVTLQPDALALLMGYEWPGNIRELRNFAENIVVLQRGGNVSAYDLDPKFRAAQVSRAPTDDETPPATPAPSPLSVEENEKRLLRDALIQAKGNRTKAAQLLGMSRRTLHRRLQQWPELDPGNGE